MRIERLARRNWTLEKTWTDFLLYPLRASPLILYLSVAWATLLTITGAIMLDSSDGMVMVLRTPLLLLDLVVFAYTMGFLQATLAAASEGKAGTVAWPRWDLITTARGGGHGLLAFLAGPVVPAVVGFFFWLRAGELEMIDWLILWELGLAAVVYWVLVVLSVSQNNDLRDLLPAAVVRAARQLGSRALLTSVLIGFPLVAQVMQTLWTLDNPHRLGAAWSLLVVQCAMQLAWAVFWLRRFGVSRYRTEAPVRPARAATPRVPVAGRAELPR